MQKTKYFLVLIFLISISYHLKGQELVSSSGNFHLNANYQVSWSLGEIMVETFTGSSTILTQGFQQSMLSVSNVFVPEDIDISIHLYPNPAKDFLIIQSGGLSDLVYFLYSTDGKLISSERITSNETSIDFESLSPGVFLIRIIQGNSHFGTYKVIKK
jgi:hypothetical protein